MTPEVTVRPRRASRIIGALFFLLMLCGFLVNFSLEAPLFGKPGFLVNAAPHARQIALGAVVGFAAEALWVGIAVTAFPIFWRRSPAAALGLLALATVVLAAAVLENVGVMSMVSVSQAYAKASAAGRDQLEAARLIVASPRNWAHYLARILDGATVFVFFAVLFRFKLVPRVLAGFGLIAAVSMLVGVGRPLFGYEVAFPMLAPLGLAQLLLAVWLFTKGFALTSAGEPRPA